MLRSSALVLVVVLPCLVGCPAKSDEGAESKSGSKSGSVAAPLPGVRIVYRINAPAPVPDTAKAQVVKTIQMRLEAMALNGKAQVRIEEGDVVVEIPGIDPTAAERTKNTLQRHGRLSFQLVDSADPLSKRLHDHAGADAAAKNDGIEVGVERWTHPGTSAEVIDYYLTARDRTTQTTVDTAKLRGCYDAAKPVVAGKISCKLTGAKILAAHLERVGAASKDLAADAQHVFVYELMHPRGPKDPPAFWRSYYVHKDSQITGSSIAKVTATMEPRTHRSSVRVELDDVGKARFADLTDKNLGSKLAIVIDEQVMSAPLIQSKVPGGVVQISMGNISLGSARREAMELAAVLRGGSIPAPLVFKSMSPLSAPAASSSPATSGAEPR